MKFAFAEEIKMKGNVLFYALTLKAKISFLARDSNFLTFAQPS